MALYYITLPSTALYGDLLHRLLFVLTLGKKVQCNDILIVYYYTYINTDTSLRHGRERII